MIPERETDTTVKPYGLMLTACVLMVIGVVMVGSANVSLDRSLFDAGMWRSSQRMRNAEMEPTLITPVCDARRPPGAGRGHTPALPWGANRCGEFCGPAFGSGCEEQRRVARGLAWVVGVFARGWGVCRTAYRSRRCGQPL